MDKHHLPQIVPVPRMTFIGKVGWNAIYIALIKIHSQIVIVLEGQAYKVGQ